MYYSNSEMNDLRTGYLTFLSSIGFRQFSGKRLVSSDHRAKNALSADHDVLLEAIVRVNVFLVDCIALTPCILAGAIGI